VIPRGAAIAAVIAAVALLMWANWPPRPLPEGAEADRVVVVKSARELVLLSGDTVLARYRISLGGQPVGDKEREGDERTPEGFYRLDYRKSDSSFHRSLHISYPGRRSGLCGATSAR